MNQLSLKYLRGGLVGATACILLTASYFGASFLTSSTGAALLVFFKSINIHK
jgi:hypothetical protein